MSAARRWLWLLVVIAAPRTESAELPVLEVYVREDCPHCEAAEDFLTDLAAARGDLEVVYHHVDRDPQSRARLVERSRAAGEWPPGVPTFVYDERILVGFENARVTGPAIAALIEARVVTDVDLPFAGRVSASELGLPLFALAMGLIDGFNPCATWVLLFLLSLLVRLENRRRMAVIAVTFVVASGAVYYAFMAAWLNLFLWIGWTERLRIVLALVALAVGVADLWDAATAASKPWLAIPEAAKPGLYARLRGVVRQPALPASLGAVIVLAVAVNFVELLCTAGLPAMFTAVLSRQELSLAGYHGYLLLYTLGYITDDALLVAIAVLALGNRRLTAGAGRALRGIAGGVMLLLGAVMLLRPQWLA
jgi:glutaredoxin